MQLALLFTVIMLTAAVATAAVISEIIIRAPGATLLQAIAAVAGLLTFAGISLGPLMYLGADVSAVVSAVTVGSCWSMVYVIIDVFAFAFVRDPERNWAAAFQRPLPLAAALHGFSAGMAIGQPGLVSAIVLLQLSAFLIGFHVVVLYGRLTDLGYLWVLTWPIYHGMVTHGAYQNDAITLQRTHAGTWMLTPHATGQAHTFPPRGWTRWNIAEMAARFTLLAGDDEQGE